MIRCRWMKLGLILGLVLMVVGNLPTESVAQDAEIEWRYAYNADEGQLVAYTLDGEMNTLVKGVLPEYYSYLSYLFPDSHALVPLEIDGTRVYFHLTPQTAEPVDIWVEVSGLSVARSAQAVILNDPNPDVASLIYDGTTGMAEELRSDFGSPFNYRFSADGQSLRYLVVSRDSGEWSIMERQLDTGEESVFFSPSPDIDPAYFDLDGIITDTYGQQWYWEYRDREAQFVSDNLVHADGTNEEILNFELGGQRPMTIRFAGDYLTIVPTRCGLDCRMTVRSANGETIELQIDDFFIPIDLIRLGETQFLMYESDRQYWRMSTDEPPELIGNQASVFVQPISPDGRWVTMLSDIYGPRQFLLWDTQTADYAFEYTIPSEDSFSLSTTYYSLSGQIWQFTNDRQVLFVAFDYATGLQIRLVQASGEYRGYFEVLQDGTVLFERYDRASAMGLGIWRYDPSTEDISPVLVDGEWRPIQFRSIP